MTDATEFDAVIVGGGPGAMEAALALSGRGLTVALVEERLFGGECHFFACNPTKALLRPVEVLELARAVPGVRELLTDQHPKLDPVFAKRDFIIEDRSDGALTQLLTTSAVSVFRGHGQLSGERRVAVRPKHSEPLTLQARHAVVLATGTRPAVPDVPGLAAARPWTNRELSGMTGLPSRALIIGGGAVGAEFATILAGLGADVTVLARGNALLSAYEPFVGEMVKRSLEDRGVTIHLDTELTRVARPEPGGVVTATFNDRSVEVDEIVLAAGRVVNTDDLGLGSVGLRDGEFVTVDDHLRAVGVDGTWLYAIGDTTGRALLSHVSQYHGRLVAQIIAARAQQRDADLPHLRARDGRDAAQVIFTNPQVVAVGLTERQAGEAGRAVTVRTATYPGPLTQLAILRDGFEAQAKLVIDSTTQTIIGATFVGPEVSEIAQAATMAVVAQIPLSVLTHVVSPHPSLNQIWDPLIVGAM